ncbi:MAG: T9SS type A sorting domain-containing protein [Bacteroidota bacterium]
MRKNLQVIKMISVPGIVLFCSILAIAQPNDWTKYEENPVLSSPLWGEGAFYSAVLYEDNIYKIWYSSVDGSSTSVAYAESDDGINWVISLKKEIEGNEGGSWQTYKGPGTVLRVNDTLRMWYTGSSDGFNIDMAVGYAYYDESLEDWIVAEDPVLEGTSGTWDAQGVVGPAVYFNDGVYHMWFHGFEGPSLYADCGIGHATSTNGVDWEKDPLPVMNTGPSGSFYNTWNISDCVQYLCDEDGICQYYLWFSGWDGIQSPFNFRIGYATSPDGINWTVGNDDLCVLDIGQAGSWDSREVRMAAVHSVNDTLRMFYSGINNTSGWNNYEIGYAWCYFPDINPWTVEYRNTEVIDTYVAPNPCTNTTFINYTLKEPASIKIGIFNYLGQEIETIEEGYTTAGTHRLSWNAEGLPSGIYYYRLIAEENNATGKIIKQ